MAWQTNPIMEWWDGDSWVKISDHGRTPLSISVERIESKERMADGTLRKYVVAKKRTFSCSWDNLPDKDVPFLTNGQPGEWMEEFYNQNDGAFRMRLRAGTDEATALASALVRTGGDPGLADNKREFTVMFSEYSKEVPRRGKAFDLWNISVTLEEV